MTEPHGSAPPLEAHEALAPSAESFGLTFAPEGTHKGGYPSGEAAPPPGASYSQSAYSAEPVESESFVNAMHVHIGTPIGSFSGYGGAEDYRERLERQPNPLTKLSLITRTSNGVVLYEIMGALEGQEPRLVRTTCFSELQKLSQQLTLEAPSLSAVFPEKTWWRMKDDWQPFADPAKMEARREGLQQYLRAAAASAAHTNAFRTFFGSYCTAGSPGWCSSLGSGPLILLIDRTDDRRRKVEEGDRWHLRSFDIWKFSLSTGVTDPLLGELQPVSVEQRFKYVERLYAGLTEAGVDIGSVKPVKGGIFTQPTPEERKVDLITFFNALLASESAKRHLLMKAFFTGFKVFEVLYKRGRNTEKEALEALGGEEGVQLWRQHQAIPDLPLWIEVRSKAMTLQAHVSKVFHEQKKRFEGFQGRRSQRQSEERLRQDSWALQPDRFAASELRQQGLQNRAGSQAARREKEERLLQAQKMTEDLLIFAGTVIGGDWDRPTVSRDTGWAADFSSAHEAHKQFKIDLSNTRELFYSLTALPEKLQKLQEQLETDSKAVAPCIQRASWEDGPLTQLDEQLMKLSRVRQAIDSKALEEKVEYELEKVSIQVDEAQGAEQLEKLTPMVSSFDSEEAAWKIELDCLEKEKVTTDAQVSLVLQKVTRTYAPLLAEEASAKKYEETLASLEVRARERAEKLENIAARHEASAVAAHEQHLRSEARSTWLKELLDAANAAYASQKESPVIGPPVVPMPDDWDRLYQDAQSLIDNFKTQLNKDSIAATALTDQFTTDRFALTSAHMVRRTLEDARNFQHEARFQPPSLSDDDIPDGVHTPEAQEFWKMVMTACVEAANKQTELLTLLQEKVVPDFQKNVREQNAACRSLACAQHWLGAFLKSLEEESRLGLQLKDIKAEHEKLRQSRVRDLDEAITRHLMMLRGSMERAGQIGQQMHNLQHRCCVRAKARQEHAQTLLSLQRSVARVKSQFSTPKPGLLAGQPAEARLASWQEWAKAYGKVKETSDNSMQALKRRQGEFGTRQQEVSTSMQQIDRDWNWVCGQISSYNSDCCVPLLKGEYKGHKLNVYENDTTLNHALERLKQAQEEVVKFKKMILELRGSLDALRDAVSNQYRLEGAGMERCRTLSVWLSNTSQKAHASQDQSTQKVMFLQEVIRYAQLSPSFSPEPGSTAPQQPGIQMNPEQQALVDAELPDGELGPDPEEDYGDLANDEGVNLGGVMDAAAAKTVTDMGHTFDDNFADKCYEEASVKLEKPILQIPELPAEEKARLVANFQGQVDHLEDTFSDLSVEL